MVTDLRYDPKSRSIDAEVSGTRKKRSDYGVVLSFLVKKKVIADTWSQDHGGKDLHKGKVVVSLHRPVFQSDGTVVTNVTFRRRCKNLTFFQ